MRKLKVCCVVTWMFAALSASAEPNESSPDLFKPGNVGPAAQTAAVETNVKKHGAKGNGVHDDTAAIQATLNASKRVYFPEGIYVITSTLTTGFPGQEILAANPFTTIIRTAAGVDAFRIDHTAIRMSSLRFEGNGIGTNGIVAHNSAFSVLDRVEVAGFLNDGIVLNTEAAVPTGDNNFLSMYNVQAGANGRDGISVPTRQGDNNALQLINTYTSSNGRNGLLYKGEGLRVFGGRYDGNGYPNGGYGIMLSEASDDPASETTFGGIIFFPWIEHNASGGIRSGGQASKNMVFRDDNLQGLSFAGDSNDSEIVAFPLGLSMPAFGQFQIDGYLKTSASLIVGELTPPTLTGNVNDYDPGGEGFWRLGSNGTVQITGIVAGRADRILTIVNAGANIITLVNQSGASSPGNRIITGNGANVFLGPNNTAILIYDATDARWRVSAVRQ